MARTKQTGIRSEKDESYRVDAKYRAQRLFKRGFSLYQEAERWLMEAKIGIS